MRNDWDTKIKQMPNATHKIIELFNNEKDWELHRYPYSALRTRKDLTPGELNNLLDKAKSIASETYQPTKHELVFASFVFALLADYPSEENEQILISHFDAHDGEFRAHIIEALKSIGTNASLPLLNDYIKTRSTSEFVDSMTMFTHEAVKTINRREERKMRSSQHQPGNAISSLETPDHKYGHNSNDEKPHQNPVLFKFSFLALTVMLIFAAVWGFKKFRIS